MKKRRARPSPQKKARKIIVYIATSADGFIARPDGGVEWLDRPSPKDHYGYPAFFQSIDTILWGRKTYEKGIELGMNASMFGAGTKNYVFTHSAQLPKPADLIIQFVNEPIKEFAQKLRVQPGKDIWMMGGGEIIGSFLDAGEIDEFSIHVIPVMIGEGIPLVGPRHRLVQLALLSTKKFPDGVVQLNYRVVGA